jgi:hypothetical protein
MYMIYEYFIFLFNIFFLALPKVLSFGRIFDYNDKIII